MSAAARKCTEAPSNIAIFRVPHTKNPPTLSRSGAFGFRKLPLKAHLVTRQIDNAASPYKS